MKYILYVLLVLFMSLNTQARTIKVAIIDSGIPLGFEGKYCMLVDFTNTSVYDTLGHGTEMLQHIKDNAKDSDYCLYIIKIFSGERGDQGNTTKAFQLAYDYNVDIINYSANGLGPDRKERVVINKLLNRGTKVVVAAGNNGLDLNKNCRSYPACYDSRIIVAGNLANKHLIHNTSNYGDVVDVWKVSGRGGTSASAAKHTGYLIHESYNNKDAVKSAIKALYKHSGMDKKVDNKVRKIKKSLPKNLVKTTEYTLPFIKMAVDRRVSYTWEF